MSTLTEAPKSSPPSFAVASDEPFLSLRATAKLAGVSRMTITNWRTIGVLQRRDGTQVRVRLHAERRGGRWMFKPALIDAFFVALTDAPDPAAAPGPARAAPEDA